jgi:molybdopterin-dependent oxidoreductase alpha subunit
VARFLGTNDVDNAARICHSPSTGALKETIGVGATTVSYTDVIDHADLIVLFGSNAANAQPVFLKYLYLAKQRGARVAVVNPFREPALEAYWVPSNVESALFGTRITDEFFPVATGGDTAFLLGVLQVLHRRGQVDAAFIAAHTDGYDELVRELERHDLADLAAWAGSSVADLERFADVYAAAGSAVLVWSMGITQHTFGTDNVRAIVDLALARGNVGRPGAGLMPIRGHSGVQGGAEMGAYATTFPGGEPITPATAAALSEAWGFPVPAVRGRSATELIEAAGRGEVDVLWSSGGNFLETLPDPAAVRRALERVPLRVHVDIVASTQMLVDGEAVLLLPAMTRYEQPGGGTETTTERRIVFSPEIPGPRVGRRPAGVGHPARARAAGRPGACPPARVRRRAGDPRGDRPGGPGLRRDRDPAHHRRPGAVGRRAAVRRVAVPDRRRARPLRPGDPAGGDPAAGSLPARHPAGQAVQLHGVARHRPDHRGGP